MLEGVVFVVLFVLTFTIEVIVYLITYPFRKNKRGYIAPTVKCQVKQFPDITNEEYIKKINRRFLSVTTSYARKAVDIDALAKELDALCIPCRIERTVQGTTINKVYLKPIGSTKINQIKRYAQDIQIAVNASSLDVTLEDGYVVLSMPSNMNDYIYFGDLIDSSEYHSAKGLALPIGQTIDHKAVIYDLDAAPHILVSGTTGSGKSVLLHSMALGLLMKNNPMTLHMYMVDPKETEFANYKFSKMCTVVTSADRAITLLNDLCVEMDRRYKILANHNCRDISDYNKKMSAPMRQEVVMIDEMADLMLTGGKRAETPIVRLAQKARACGIHLILATQRPTRDVVTGLIKANIPTRICLAVKSHVDSMVAIDQTGGEKLLGKGDMLFLPNGQITPQRLLGGYVTATERDNIIYLLKQMGY